MHTQMRCAISLAALAGMLAVSSARADINIGYSVDGTAKEWLAGFDYVQLIANNNAAVTVPDNGSAVAKLNDLKWYLTQFAWDGSGNLSRTIGINLAAGTQVLSQDMTVDVNYRSEGEMQVLEIGASSPVQFQWNDGGGNHVLTVTALPLTLRHPISYFDCSGETVWGEVNGTFSLATTPVPEPTTLLAGALLLLPFGVNTIRALRKKHTP